MKTDVITRKYVLIPVRSERKEWEKRVEKFFANESQRYKELIEKEITDDQKRKSYENKLKNIQINLENAKKKIYTKKMIDDYTFGIIRQAMDSEAQIKNYVESAAFSNIILKKHGNVNKEECEEEIRNILNCAGRVIGKGKNFLLDDTGIKSPVGAYGCYFSKEFINSFWNLLKSGLAYGKVSIKNFRSTIFTLSAQCMGFTSNYETNEELLKNIYDSGVKLYFNYGANGEPTVAKFLIDTGHGKNHAELMSVLGRIYSGEYQYCGSKICFKKIDGEKGDKIILNLAMKIPKQSVELNENVVVGVDVGEKIPAVCALNNNDFIKEFIGDGQTIIENQTKYKKQRKRLYESCSACKGGHGRKKKLKRIQLLRDREKNWNSNYNHMVSKKVVEFAVKNKAKYINLEDLSGINPKRTCLGEWTYYELQCCIEYKAKRYGIIVRKIDPAYTSQTCSCCGNLEDGQRDGRKFKCKSCGKEFHADFNAARNIAMSENFIED